MKALVISEKSILIYAKKKTLESIANAELGSKKYNKLIKYYGTVVKRLKELE